MSPKLGKQLFRTSLPKWVRVDQNEYELTRQWVWIDQLSTNWPKSWVRIDQNENELTWVRTDLSTSWLGAVSNRYSSMFHNRYLLESILKLQVQIERMSNWHNFIKKWNIVVLLSHSCALTALWKSLGATKHTNGFSIRMKKISKRNWMRRLIRALVIVWTLLWPCSCGFFLLYRRFYGQVNIITFISSRSSGEL